MHNNIAIEMLAGLHEFDDAQFTFGKVVSMNEPLIQFGHISHIIVKAGEARAIWEEGKLKILREGRYDFDSALLTVAPTSIPLQDIVKQLHQIKVSTNDRFQMFVSGQVTYRIENPEQLIKNIGQEKLAEYIEQRTDAILRNKISEKNLSMISPELHAELKDKAHAAGLQLFGSNKDKIEGGDDHRGMLCSEIMEKLIKDTSTWGIKIAEFAISEIGFQDRALENSLAEASAKTRMAESALHLQQAQNVTETSKIKAVSAQKTIEQENAASILEINTQAKNKALIATANANAEAEVAGRKIAADALFYTAEKEGQAAVIGLKIQADAALHVAKANSDAAKLRSEGEIAEANAKLVLLNNPNYLQLEMLRLQLQISQNLANMPTPAVVFNGNGATSAANSMFLGNGVSMMEFAMKQKGNLFGRGRNPAPTEVVAQPARSRSNSLN